MPRYDASFGIGALGIRRMGRYGAAAQHAGRRAGPAMAEGVIPHFHNDRGVAVIEIGAKEFMCVGATPPFDHPHVFIDMGDESEAICPYCSTLYRYDSSLHGDASRPPECAWTQPATA
jgi:uncharacterized Zn-finger protein